LMYSLYIPEKLNLDNVNGNIEKVEKFSSVESESAAKILEMEAAKGEIKKPIARKDISQSVVYVENQEILERNVQAAISGRISGLSNRALSMDESGAGLLPLKIYIPTTGKLLRFEKRLVMDENLFLKARYKLVSR
ncbi:MAG TPA: hypothetical protein PL060_02705, partial [bacterium]|nr:hypothetical protein [bacterium]